MQSETQAATLTRLLQQYEPALWRLVNSYEFDRSRREDLFQEIALGLWKAIPRFRGDSSERTWLYRIAHNIAISTLDTRRRQERNEFPLTDRTAEPTGGESPERVALSEEKREVMMKAIRELPAIDRQVIVLHLEGLSYGDIEEISGLSQSAIATRLSRIRSRLAEVVQRKEVRQ